MCSTLDKGIATITQSQDFFDCYPAVMASYEFTKNYKKELEADEEVDNANYFEIPEPVQEEEHLEFKDFSLFLAALKNYFILCQVKKRLDNEK